METKNGNIYNTANIKIIAEQLKWVRDNGYSTAILMGAGMSFSAGIPTAKDIIEKIKNQFPYLCAACKKETYPAYMSLLAPAERKKFIGDFIDKAKINLAHLYLGSLVEKGFVDRILTTNFDPLAIRSLALFNIYPAVYDFAASQSFIPGEAAQISVFHLHGQRDGFVLLNTEEEVKRHSEKLKNVFQDADRRRCWIVIGYSGKNDPVFERLAEIEQFQHNLFWIGYNDEEPAKHVLDNILEPEKYGYYVKGYDADRFFLDLAKKLSLSEPQIISKPFSYLKKTINAIKEYTIDDKLADPTKETKKWIDAAIKGFEEGKGFEFIKNAEKSRIKDDELIRKTRDIWIHSSFDQINEIFDDVISSGIEEAKEYLTYALYSWGKKLSDSAEMKKDKEKYKEAEKLFRQSIEIYEQVLKINPNEYKSLYGYGNALLNLAKMKKDKDAEELFNQSIEKFKILENENKKGTAAINPTYDIVHVYSLMGNVEESLKWLEKGLKEKSTPPRKYILVDSDLNNIKKSENEFMMLIDKYLPG